MNNSRQTWWVKGIEYGWIERYEQELIRFLEEQYGRLSKEEKMCVVFTSLFLKAGHTCLPLSEKTRAWAQILGFNDREISLLPKGHVDISLIKSSAVVGIMEEMKPLVLTDSLLSFRKNIMQEHKLLQWIRNKSKKSSTSDISFYINKNFPKKSTDEIDWQMVASMLALIKPFLIISGGPGTGKTTTIAKILNLLQSLSDTPLKIALAAPTGKAASRMGEALFTQLSNMNLSEKELRGFPKEAKTIHRLLAGTEEKGLLPPVEKKMLRYDVVVIDEASMIDLSLMYRLIRHLNSDTKLILLGDKFQLASVEAGSVFSDLCQKQNNGFTKETAQQLVKMGLNIDLPVRELSELDDSMVYLTKSYRFGKNSGIGILSEKIKTGDTSKTAVGKLFKEYKDIEHVEFQYQKEDFDRMINGLISRIEKSMHIANPQQLINFWKESVWLSGLRRGLAGTDRLNNLTEQQIGFRRLAKIENGWYHGRPIIITQNDYGLGLFNGDMGVCVKDDQNKLWVYVESGAELKRFKTQQITKYAPSYFLTVHKSQGSEFDAVQFLLPRNEHPLLSKELLYTAITRAKETFFLYGDLNVFNYGAGRETLRYTGLKHLIEKA